MLNTNPLKIIFLTGKEYQEKDYSSKVIVISL